MARVDRGPPGGEDGRLACTGAPGSIDGPAKALQISQESTNKEVVWIVATGRKPGIYMTAEGAKDQWHGYSGARHCAMNRRQFEQGEHVTWYKTNYGRPDCVIKPAKGRKRRQAADDSSDEDE